jgi:hypothetical protein
MDQDRNELYIKMLDEDNTMLIEDNNILRDKITSIQKLVEKSFIDNTKELKECTNINTGRVVRAKVPYIIKHKPYVPEGYVVMSIKNIKRSEGTECAV